MSLITTYSISILVIPSLIIKDGLIRCVLVINVSFDFLYELLDLS